MTDRSPSSQATVAIGNAAVALFERLHARYAAHLAAAGVVVPENVLRSLARIGAAEAHDALVADYRRDAPARCPQCGR